MVEITIGNADRLYDSFECYVKYNNRAVMSAMNRANKQAKNALVRETRKDWTGIKSKRLKAYSRTSNATKAKPITRFYMRSGAISLFDFNATQNTRGVSYKLKNRRKRTMKHAFIPKDKSGRITKKQVLIRDNRKDKNGASTRYPLSPKFSITPTSMVLGSDADKVYINTFTKTFIKRYKNQAKYLCSKYGGIF